MNPAFGSLAVALLMLLVGIAAPAMAQSSTKPATQPAKVSAFDGKPLQRTLPVDASGNPATAPKPVTPPSSQLGTTRVILALALVIVVILLLRWIAQQFFGAPSAKKSSQAVQVLSRNLVSPKQQILLLQVGRRVLVIGDRGGQMSSLAQITDQDEIASLISQLRADKADPVTRAFSSVFGKAQKELNPPDEDDALAHDAADAGIDPSLATTQAELSGLMEKVRDVAKSMGQRQDSERRP